MLIFAVFQYYGQHNLNTYTTMQIALNYTGKLIVQHAKPAGFRSKDAVIITIHYVEYLVLNHLSVLEALFKPRVDAESRMTCHFLW